MKVGIDDYLVKQEDPAAALQVLLDEALPADPIARVDAVAAAPDPGAEAVALLADLSFAAALRAGGIGVVDVVASRLKEAAGISRKAVEEKVAEFVRAMAKSAKAGQVGPADPEAESEVHADAAADSAANAKPLPLRGSVTEGPGGYYARDGRDVVRISSFLIQPTMRVNLDGVETVFADIHTDAGTVHRNVCLGPEVWRSRKEFLPSMGRLDCQWTGSDQNLQGVRREVAAKKVPIRKGTRKLGYVETKRGPRWVAPEVFVGPEGVIDDPPIIYVPNGPGLHDRLKYVILPPDRLQPLAAKALPRLIELNEPAVILPIIGWFFATPFRPRLVALIGHFPFLCVWGGAGGGKTSLVELLWRLFGFADSRPYSATGTDFPIIKLLADSESVPVFVDEYKPADMPPTRVQLLIRLLRRAYGGETEERGRPDRTVERYQVSAPIVLAGEARPEGGRSLGERMISVIPNPNRLDGETPHTRAFAELDGLDLGGLALPYIQFTLGQDVRELLDNGRAYADHLLSQAKLHRPLPRRCRDNLAIMAMGLLAFRRFATEMGVALPEFDAVPAVAAVANDVSDGDRGPKDGLDLFLETIAALARNGKIIDSRHYAVVNGKLNLHLRSCHEVYLEHVRRTGAIDATNGLSALRRLVRENQERKGYVVKADHHVVLGGQRVRCVEIDFERAQEVLDVDDFPSGENRGWGGYRGWDRDEEGKPRW